MLMFAQCDCRTCLYKRDKPGMDVHILVSSMIHMPAGFRHMFKGACELAVLAIHNAPCSHREKVHWNFTRHCERGYHMKP